MRTDMELMNRLFHAALRRDLERAIETLESSEGPPAEQRAALTAHVDLVLDLLHRHHTGEDIGLWPLVRRRAPDLGAQLDLMETEHAAVAEAIGGTRAAAGHYAATTDSSTADQFREALVALSGVLLPHLDHEETEVMPRVMRALTQRDWSTLSRKEVRRWGSFSLAATGLVWMADGIGAFDREAFNHQVSGVFPWLVDKLYGGAYRRRTTLAFGPS